MTKLKLLLLTWLCSKSVVYAADTAIVTKTRSYLDFATEKDKNRCYKIATTELYKVPSSLICKEYNCDVIMSIVKDQIVVLIVIGLIALLLFARQWHLMSSKKGD